MGNNDPTIYYINDSFLVFEPEHALRLRRDRVVGHSMNPPAGPYCFSKFSIAVIVEHKLANFKKFVPRDNVNLDENRLKFSKLFAEMVDKEREDYNNQRVMELNRRNIPVNSKTMKQFDDSKMRLAITNVPTEHYSALDSVTMEESEIKSLLDFNDPKSVTFLDLYNRGFYISSGMKFGCEFLAYEGDPVRYHAQYAIRVVDCIEHESSIDLSKVDFNEINSFQRLAHAANKIPIFATVSTADGHNIVMYRTLKEREYLNPESSNEIFKSISLDMRDSNKHRRIG